MTVFTLIPESIFEALIGLSKYNKIIINKNNYYCGYYGARA